MVKLSIYKYVRLDAGWRYCKAAFHLNGKIKPNVVIVNGMEDKHAEGSYFLNFNNRWLLLAAMRSKHNESVRSNLLRWNTSDRGEGSSSHAGIKRSSVGW
jgi:hypothetical protein